MDMWVTFGLAGVNPRDETLKVFSRVHAVLRRWFELRDATGAAAGATSSVPRMQVEDVSVLDQDKLVAKMAFDDLNANYVRPGGHRKFGPDLGIIAGPDSALPPHIPQAINLSMGWEDQIIKGVVFADDFAHEVYPKFIRAVRDELGAIRIVDGKYLYQFKDPYGYDEAHARFVYYRDPLAFVKSFLLLRGLEGDPEAIVPVLRELAEKDTLTERHYEHDDARYGAAGSAVKAARALETGPGGLGRVKRLRFTTEGGVILERGRFAVGDPQYYIQSQAAPDHLLREELEARGLVRPLPAAAVREPQP